MQRAPPVPKRTTSVRLCTRRSDATSGTSLMTRIAAAHALTGRQIRTAPRSTTPACNQVAPSTGSAPKPTATAASPMPRADSCTPGSEYSSPRPSPAIPNRITPYPRDSVSMSPRTSAPAARPIARCAICARDSSAAWMKRDPPVYG